jgi:hypothetical protein
MTMRVRYRWIAVWWGLPLTAMAGTSAQEGAGTPERRTGGMNDIAESYVKLVLAIGQHDPNYVDAYYGPPEWKKEAEAGKRPLDELAARTRTLLDAVSAISPPSAEIERLRHQYLVRTYIESRPGVAGNVSRRWEEFAKLLSSPRLPSTFK